MMMMMLTYADDGVVCGTMMYRYDVLISCRIANHTIYDTLLPYSINYQLYKDIKRYH